MYRTEAFTENRSGPLVYMTAPGLAARHAFTTRFGGVSEGIYSSLNLSMTVGDDPARVSENCRILCAALGIEEGKLVFSRQVHGRTVRPCTSSDTCPTMADVPYEADGIVTAEHGLALMIFSADCTPILLSDPATGAVGAVHAGWRGTVADIAGEAVRTMAREFGSRPADLHAAIGPCISACCFETGPEVPEAVRAVLGTGAEEHIRPAGPENKSYIDLKGINRALLLRAGLLPDLISVSDECTVCRCDKYWSHRATGGRRGSQASVIICG